MNLRELNAGTPATKTWLAPIVGSLDCGELTTESFAISGRSVASQAFAQTATSTNSANKNEVNTFGVGVGSLSIPANYFVAGSSGSLKLFGSISNSIGDELTLRLYAGATGTVQIGSVLITIAGASTAKRFSASFNFTLRVAGTAGNAILSTHSEYSQGTDANNIRVSADGYLLNTATFDTTTVNNFRITSEWSTFTGALGVDNLVLTV